MSDQRDVVVVERGGSGIGVILGIIALIIVLAAGWYFLVGPGAAGTESPSDVNVNVEVPQEVVPDAS